MKSTRYINKIGLHKYCITVAKSVKSVVFVFKCDICCVVYANCNIPFLLKSPDERVSHEHLKPGMLSALQKENNNA